MRIFTWGVLLSTLVAQNAKIIERVGTFTRGQLSLGIDSKIRASYYQQVMAYADQIAGEMRVVASGVLKDPRTSEITRHTVVTANRWTRALTAEVERLEALGEHVTRVRLPPGYDPRTGNLHHAEILLLELGRGKEIISIGSGKPICTPCWEALEAASRRQLEIMNSPIIFF